MFVVCKLPGKGQALSQSMQDQILCLALLWSRELRRNPLPDFYSWGCRYVPEPEDNLAEEWVDPYVTRARGHGDCDDMVIAVLAQILARTGWTLSDGLHTLPAWPAIAWLRGTGRYHVMIRHRKPGSGPGFVLDDPTLEDPAKAMLKRFGGNPEEVM